MGTLREEIAAVLNKKCVENESNTPDFILAAYLIECLESFETAIKRRDKWYSVHLEPANSYFVRDECKEA